VERHDYNVCNHYLVVAVISLVEGAGNKVYVLRIWEYNIKMDFQDWDGKACTR